MLWSDKDCLQFLPFKDLWGIPEDSWIQRHLLDGQLLDWGDQPLQVSGLAHDGKQLWALDKKNKRICALERAQGQGAASRLTSHYRGHL